MVNGTSLKRLANGLMSINHFLLETSYDKFIIIMIKLISRLLLPIAIVFGALFGYSFGQGHPQYWYLVVIVILFLLDMGITFVLDKLSDFNFYKDSAIKLWALKDTLKKK
jgi:hypothetical protein